MKKGLLVITALLIAVVLPMSLAAQEKDIEVKVEVKECDHGYGKSIHAKCNLDPEIALKLEKLTLELKLKNLELEKKQTEIHKEIYGAYLEEKPDVKKIKKLTKAMLTVKAELMENQHEHLLAVRKLVPAENFKMFMTHHGHGGKMGACRCDCCSHGKMDGCKTGKSCCSTGSSKSGCKSIKSSKGCGSHGKSASGCSAHKGAGKCEVECKDIKIIKKVKK